MKKTETHHEHGCESDTHNIGHEHGSSFIEEIIHHTPYAIFSVSLGFVLLSFTDFIGRLFSSSSDLQAGYNTLFHSFHFLHIVFAATGTLLTFFRFSDNKRLALLIGFFCPTFFCILSDGILPYYAGQLLGVSMELHLCFLSELPNVLPFLLIGMLNGYVLSKHSSQVRSFFYICSHFLHILVSALAALFYLVSHGLDDWYPRMGFMFLFLVLVVVIPCTLSDVIVPLYFARRKEKNETNTPRKN